MQVRARLRGDFTSIMLKLKKANFINKKITESSWIDSDKIEDSQSSGNNKNKPPRPSPCTHPRRKEKDNKSMWCRGQHSLPSPLKEYPNIY